MAVANILPDGLANWLDDAVAARQLPELLPDTADPARINDADSALYVRAARSRLASLGYLEAGEAKLEVVTPAFTEAVRRFQREVGFRGEAVDGWIGPETKARLQQLVSFEESQDVAAWGAIGVHPEAYPAVARAVYLRLYALGFMDWAHALTGGTECRPAANPVFRVALEDFALAAGKLGLISAPLPAALAPPTLRVLFDHDAWMRALATHPQFLADPDNERVVDACGRIELWLLGYDVNVGRPLAPSGTKSARTLRSPPRTLDPVAAALEDWRARFPCRRRALDDRRFGSQFFAQTTELATSQRGDLDDSLQEALLARMANNADRLLENLKSLAARAWDGIRRVWGWLKHALQHAAALAETELRNIARLIALGARKSYAVLAKAIDIVHHAALYWAGPVYPGSDMRTAVLHFGKDFDTSLLIHRQAAASDVAMLLARERRTAAYLIEACRIWAVVLATLRRVGGLLAAGVTPPGWFVLLITLAREASRLRELGREIADWRPDGGAA